MENCCIYVTEHYYYIRACFGWMDEEPTFIVFRTGNTQRVSAFMREEDAIKECKYLEKLNFSKRCGGN